MSSEAFEIVRRFFTGHTADEAIDAEHAIDRAITHAVQAERERCEWFAEELARVHSAGASKTRESGSYTVRSIIPFFKRYVAVKPSWEARAQAQDGAAHSLRVIARAIRENWKRPDGQ